MAERLPDLSRARIQQLLRQGKAGLEPPPAKGGSLPALKPGHRLRGGEQVWVEVEPPPPLHAFAEPLPLTVLYEDEDLAVVDKPAGMVVHSGAGVRSGTLVNALLHHFQTLSQLGGEQRPGIVHRLDRHTSGVMLVAKHDLAHRRLAQQFSGRTIEKHYVALVHGTMKKAEGTINAPVSRDPARRIRMTAKRRAGRAALTRYRVLRRFQGLALLDVQILTGRTHQVRVHLSSIGHPVVGDTLYGAPSKLPANLFRHDDLARFVTASAGAAKETDTAKAADAADATAASKAADKANSFGRPAGKSSANLPKPGEVPTLPRNFLHAATIRFRHPQSGSEMEMQSPLPPELEKFLSRLKATPEYSGRR